MVWTYMSLMVHGSSRCTSGMSISFDYSFESATWDHGVDVHVKFGICLYLCFCTVAPVSTLAVATHFGFRYSTGHLQITGTVGLPLCANFDEKIGACRSQSIEEIKSSLPDSATGSILSSKQLFSQFLDKSVSGGRFAVIGTDRHAVPHFLLKAHSNLACGSCLFWRHQLSCAT